jgi:hypothetical protein
MTFLSKLFNTKSNVNAIAGGQIRQFVEERCQSLIPQERIPLTSAPKNSPDVSYKAGEDKISNLPYDILGIIFKFAILGDDGALTKEKYIERDHKTIRAIRHTSQGFRSLINSTELGCSDIAFIKYPEFIPPAMHINDNNINRLKYLNTLHKENKITPNIFAKLGDLEYKQTYQETCEHELETRISHLTHKKNGVGNNVVTQLLHGIYEKFYIKHNPYSGFSLKNKSFTLDDLKNNSDLCFLLLIAKQLGFKIQGLDLNNPEHIEIIRAGANDYLLDKVVNNNIPKRVREARLASLAEIPQNKTYIQDLGSVISTDTNFS